MRSLGRTAGNLKQGTIHLTRERQAEEDEEEKKKEEKVSLASEVRKGIWLFDAPNAALGVPNQVFIAIYSYL